MLSKKDVGDSVEFYSRMIGINEVKQKILQKMSVQNLLGWTDELTGCS